MMIIHNTWEFSKNSDDYLYVSGNFYDEDYDDEYDYDDNYIDGVYGSKKEFSSGLSDNNKVYLHKLDDFTSIPSSWSPHPGLKNYEAFFK